MVISNLKDSRGEIAREGAEVMLGNLESWASPFARIRSSGEEESVQAAAGGVEGV